MITGRTKIIAHIGVPTESFKAPMIYNPWFEANGIDTVVVPMGCEAEDFPGFLQHVFRLRNIAGALITMPHKRRALDLVHEASAVARVSGACNAVRRKADGRLAGDMFDGEGFVRGVIRRGKAVRGASALVIGCGGVGSAISAALAQEGLARLGLFDVDGAAMSILVNRLARHFPGCRVVPDTTDPAGWDIVVNATPLGMSDTDPLPIDPARLSPSTFVGEVVLSRAETPLLAAARSRGCETQIGLDMLFEQIPAYLEFFGYSRPTPDDLRRTARTGDA